MNRTPSQSGFTVIEVLVVVGIFGILSALALVFSMDFYRTYASSSELNNVVSVLSKARARSVANVNQHWHGACIDTANRQYTLFQGSGSTIGYSNRITSLDESVPSGTSPDDCPGGSEITFEQLSGNTNCTSDCMITLNNFDRVKTVTINSQGAILW